MGVKHVSVPKRFDSKKWAELIVDFVGMFETVREAAVMAGVSDTALHTWMRETYAGGFRHPSMSNFIRICNLMDVDPSEFFTWE